MTGDMASPLCGSCKAVTFTMLLDGFVHPKRFTDAVVERLEDVFPDDDHNNRSIWRAYLPHARCVLESRLVDQDQQSRMSLLWRYATCLSADGRWDEAEAAYVESLEIEKRELGAGHPDTLTSMNNLAFTWKSQGRVDDAINLMEECVTLRTQIIGINHPNTSASHYLDGRESD
ncbi:Tetratricopeptide repeat-domain-containing protein [Cadophora sp. MPI-SDFR-AT-0126]|nr:Tetratricopeptide repeat-domain-containing protein [Leotiomycetes sp. MPI-SDFR-AT-0126]